MKVNKIPIGDTTRRIQTMRTNTPAPAHRGQQIAQVTGPTAAIRNNRIPGAHRLPSAAQSQAQRESIHHLPGHRLVAKDRRQYPHDPASREAR